MMKRLSAITVINRSDSEVEGMPHQAAMSGQNILLAGQPSIIDAVTIQKPAGKKQPGDFRILNKKFSRNSLKN
jgi:hypothetical protein